MAGPLPVVPADELGRRLGLDPATNPHLDTCIRVATSRLEGFVDPQLVGLHVEAWEEAVTLQALYVYDAGTKGTGGYDATGDWTTMGAPTWAQVRATLQPCMPTGGAVIA